MLLSWFFFWVGGFWLTYKIVLLFQLMCMFSHPLVFDLFVESFLILLFPLREAMKVNGQMDCHPSAQGAALSPSRHSNVKKVTGVGGTTYEISVWAGTPHPPMTHSGRSATEILLCYFNKITGSEGCIVPPLFTLQNQRISLLFWGSCLAICPCVFVSEGWVVSC